ncbi:MAG TPA: ferritin-like domain-containing protein [Chloroflexota bacterium]|nr:ferritin-like domain-containing protein [Chloroflexota bacterium]
MEELSKHTATENLLRSFGARRSRLSLLKGALGAGAAITGASLLGGLPARAATNPVEATAEDTFTTIFTIARTAEQLAVTFYQNGIANAGSLGLSGLQLDNIKAAAIEEQSHQQLFTTLGGASLASSFSFPQGQFTFTNLGAFIETQQQLEGVFDAAFIAAVYEFAQAGRPDLAQVAAEIAMVESEHRALGRNIAAEAGLSAYDGSSYSPANNWVFGLLTLEAVGDAPAIVTAAGFLGPNANYAYVPIDYMNDPVYSGVYSRITSRAYVTSNQFDDGDDPT